MYNKDQEQTQTAIIVGVRGQDGRLLRSLLESANYKIIGVSRDQLEAPNLQELQSSSISVTNQEQVEHLIDRIKPKYVFYLAAQHSSSEQANNEEQPRDYESYHACHVVGFHNFLWAIKSKSPLTRIFYAASSLVFSGSNGFVQDEYTPFDPQGFYGLTKLQGLMLCREYRRKYGTFAAGGILYNHESIFRKSSFLSKRIIEAAYKISIGLQEELEIGSLDTRVDWGYAPDFTEAMKRILDQEIPDDYIIATGESHTVAEFAEIAFGVFGLDSRDYIRPNLRVLNRIISRKEGNYAKLKQVTGWEPSLTFEQMVKQITTDYITSVSCVNE